MKKLLLILSFVLFSFGANAGYTIEMMYKICKPLQSSGFNSKSIPKEAKMSSMACKIYFDALVSSGVGVCGSLQVMQEEGYNLNTPNFKALRDLNSNGVTKTFPAIASFINFAENNANLWKESISSHKYKFLGTKFPCKIDN